VLCCAAYVILWPCDSRSQAQGRGAEAIEHFQQACEIDPLFADAHFNLGLELMNAGRTDLARK
jgi:Flp pilus assembly protein TadD